MSLDTSNSRNSRSLFNGPDTALIEKTNHKLFAAVPIYMLLIVFPIQFSIGPIAMNGARTIALLFIIPLAVNLLSGKYGRLVWADLLFFAYCIWAFIALMVTNPESALQFSGAQTLELYGSYLLGRAYVRTENDLISVIKILSIFIAISIPFALFEGLTGRSLALEILRYLPVVSTPSPGNFGERLGIQRAQFVFTHAIHYGLYCSLGFTLALIGLKHIVSTPLRIMFMIASVLGVFFSMSSGALLYIFIQLFLIIWASVFRSFNSKWFLLALFIVASYVTIDILSNRSPIKVFMSYATFSPHNAYYRSIIFEWGMVNIWDNPIFGIGMNDWVRPPWMISSSVDNFWLLITMRSGIPAFFLLATGYALALWKIGTAKIEPQSTRYRLRRSWMFTFIGVTFTLTTVHIWWSIFSFVFFMFGTGIWFMEKSTTARKNGVSIEHDAGPSDAAGGADSVGRRKQTLYTRFPPSS